MDAMDDGERRAGVVESVVVRGLAAAPETLFVTSDELARRVPSPSVPTRAGATGGSDLAAPAARGRSPREDGPRERQAQARELRDRRGTRSRTSRRASTRRRARARERVIMHLAIAEEMGAPRGPPDHPPADRPRCRTSLRARSPARGLGITSVSGTKARGTTSTRAGKPSPRRRPRRPRSTPAAGTRPWREKRRRSRTRSLRRARDGPRTSS